MIVLAVDDKKIPLAALEDAIIKAEPNASVHGFRNAADALSFAESEPCDVAFLDIDMQDMNGIELAKRLKIKKSNINIVFSTGYSEYTGEALSIHCSGYIMKPVTPEKVRNELDNLRFPVQIHQAKRVRFQTFGNFEVYVDGNPLSFKYEKTKELLAYLVDRCGALCTNGEIMAKLWSDDTHFSYLRSLKKDLLDTLKEKNCSEIILQQWGKMGIHADQVDCDYYEWQQGEVNAINRYHGEYMAQYSWGELTNGTLTHFDS